MTLQSYLSKFVLARQCKFSDTSLTDVTMNWFSSRRNKNQAMIYLYDAWFATVLVWVFVVLCKIMSVMKSTHFMRVGWHMHADRRWMWLYILQQLRWRLMVKSPLLVAATRNSSDFVFYRPLHQSTSRPAQAVLTSIQPTDHSFQNRSISDMQCMREAVTININWVRNAKFMKQNFPVTPMLCKYYIKICFRHSIVK